MGVSSKYPSVFPLPFILFSTINLSEKQSLVSHVHKISVTTLSTKVLPSTEDPLQCGPNVLLNFIYFFTVPSLARAKQSYPTLFPTVWVATRASLPQIVPVLSVT